jgi:tRNA A37 methylthiotransferase MiaB
MREKTHAHRNMVDDVPEEIKKDRLKRMIDVFLKNQWEASKKDIGR